MSHSKRFASAPGGVDEVPEFPIEIDLDGARRYLRETLPAAEPIAIHDPGVLDAAAAVIALGGGAA